MKKKIFKNFIIALAPMAGVTDFAFRKICADFGADMVTTEMISAKAYEHNSIKTNEMLREEKHTAIKCVQIFGHEETAIKTIIKSGALDKFDVIDFNCGCPAPKIVKNKEGSFLLSDINKAEKLIQTIRESTNKPISVKFRLGINDNINFIEFGQMCERNGVDFLILHARTREQQYAGVVDKNAYTELVKAVKIPVIWSGDIKTKEDVDFAKKIGCKGVMIGRNALGNPEIFSKLKNKLPPYNKKEAIKIHLDLIKNHLKNDKVTFNYFKKHLAWYCKNLKNSSELRASIMSVNSLDEMEKIIDNLDENF